MMFIALMDEDGFVQFASVDNVAHTARVKNKEAAEAIKILESPDENSANHENDGKRIERVPGGWVVINAKDYRDLVTRDMIRQQTAIRVARHRAKQKNVTHSNAPVTHSNGSETISVSVSRVHKKEARMLSGQQSSEDFLKNLEADPTYNNVDVRREYGKMKAWCRIRNKQPTERRFVNWLNNVDMPMKDRKQQDTIKPQPDGWTDWLHQTYPQATQKNFWKVPHSIQEEFKQSTKTKTI